VKFGNDFDAVYINMDTANLSNTLILLKRNINESNQVLFSIYKNTYKISIPDNVFFERDSKLSIIDINGNEVYSEYLSNLDYKDEPLKLEKGFASNYSINIISGGLKYIGKITNNL
jgi:hypothetical protein